MKTSKSVICKCERCNKPFKAYSYEDNKLCKSCKAIINEEKLMNITGKSIPKRMVRTEYDAFKNRIRDLEIKTLILQEEIKEEENRKNSTFEKRVCKDCGKEFAITVGEKEFYESNDLFLPVRCGFCRRNRKKNK